MPLGPGSRLDAYELVRPVGSGGMGEVWLATDVRLGRKVALKLLPAELTRDPLRVARFEQEARAASALNHPNVCTILVFGQTAEGQHYIAMELVEGQTLRTRLAVSRLTIRESLDIAIQVASALSAAHAAGIVHRDIKPENVMLRPDGLVKVLDFGLAKLAMPASDEASGASTQTILRTEVGTVLGTVAYMSPEQARGQEVDARTDIWSLGVILYEMIAGRSPFEGATKTDILVGILERDPDPLSRFEATIPSELERIVTKALRKERDKRYQVVKDLLLDLEALRELRASQATQSSGGTPLPITPAGRYKRVFPGAAIALAAVLGAAGWWAAQRLMGSGAPAAASRIALHPLTRLTIDAGLQTDVTWSPDGQSIAYASDREGNFDIWVQRLDGSAPVQLTKSPAQDRQPDWSPDGSTIVFSSNRDGGGIFAIPAGGGAEHRLSAFGVRPKWAPDGSQILFASTDLYISAPALFTIRLDGQPARPVLQSFLKQLAYMGDWNWYPDSRRVSVIGATQNTFGPIPAMGLGIYTVPLAEGPPVMLKFPPELGGCAGAFAWATSGTTLYLECESNAIHNLEKLTVDPQTMTILSGESVTAGDGWESRAAPSSNGDRLAFTMSRMSLRLWSFPFDRASGKLLGEGTPVTDAGGRVETSDLSRDGTQLAYLLGRPGTQKEEFWTTDLASGESRLLANDDQGRDSPQWSRDGRALAYSWFRKRYDQTAEQSLAVRRLDGNEEQIVMTPQRRAARVVDPFDWSADGMSILGTAPLPGLPSDAPVQYALMLWPLAAAPQVETAVKVLAADKAFNIWQGNFSPDGRWICFNGVSQVEPGVATIFVIPSGGAERSRWIALTGAHEWADKPRWSPDGKLIYYILRQGSFFNLWAAPFDVKEGKAAGAPFQITHFDSPRREISTSIGRSDIGVSAKRVVLTIMEQTGSIWMLDGMDR
jgi:serine/threonine protein kinase/Tol biopolymer transport system component